MNYFLFIELVDKDFHDFLFEFGATSKVFKQIKDFDIYFFLSSYMRTICVRG